MVTSKFLECGTANWSPSDSFRRIESLSSLFLYDVEIFSFFEQKVQSFFFLQDRIGNVECIWNEREINLNISNKVQERSWKYFPKIKTRQNFEYVMMFKSIKMKFLFIVFPCKLSKFTCWKEMYMFLYFLLIVGMYNVHFVTYRLFLSFFKILYSN